MILYMLIICTIILFIQEIKKQNITAIFEVTYVFTSYIYIKHT